MGSYALVAEPDADYARTYEEMLTERGLEAVVADDGLEAQRVLAERGPPALVVTELVLAGLDGFQLVATIRRSTPAARTPVLVVSGFRELRETAAALRTELGIGAILAKAASWDSIDRMIDRLLAGGTAVLDAGPLTEDERRRETQRLARLEAASLVDDGPPDAELQAIVTAAARDFDVPIALLSLVLRDRQWFKAYVGLGVRETPRDVSFCRHAVEARAPLVVPDATGHPYFASNPFVRDGIVRGYAGAPLVTSAGDVWGTLCIITSSTALLLGKRDLDRLLKLAKLAVAKLEQRAPATQAAGQAPTQFDPDATVLRGPKTGARRG